MNKYEIVNSRYRNSKAVAHLYIDNTKDLYSIEISRDVEPRKLPMILAESAKKGKYSLTNEQSRRWVQDRIIPPGRQNIGSVLKNAGLKFYDEVSLLELNSGRCIQDNFIVRKCL